MDARVKEILSRYLPPGVAVGLSAAILGRAVSAGTVSPVAATVTLAAVVGAAFVIDRILGEEP